MCFKASGLAAEKSCLWRFPIVPRLQCCYMVANSMVFTAAEKQPAPYWLLLVVGLDVVVLAIAAYSLFRVTGSKKAKKA